jgi:hypothetical protein
MRSVAHGVRAAVDRESGYVVCRYRDHVTELLRFEPALRDCVSAERSAEQVAARTELDELTPSCRARLA